MIFYDENGNVINTKKCEYREQELANTYITSDDVVLELGARYGTVSCIINKKLNNKKNQVVVEPDERVWESLERNKKNNECEFHIVKGFISNKTLDLTNKSDCKGYGTTAIDVVNSNIPSFTLNQIKTKYKLQFNVLVADCEGFLEIFFDENPELYQELNMVIFESDYTNKCNYDKIRNNLLDNGFRAIVKGYQNVYKK